MLNKITKLICTGVIIGVNGLCVWGNRIDVKREDYPIYVVEGKDGIELPEALSDPNNSELWYEYDPLVEFVGIRLNFPEEIIQRCEDECWRIRDENKIRELEEDCMFLNVAKQYLESPNEDSAEALQEWGECKPHLKPIVDKVLER